MAAYCRQMGDDVMGQQCRTLYAGVLLSRGEWNEAERTLQDATGRLRLTRPAMAADGLVRLADLRRRQGRLEEAAALYRELEEDPFRSQGEPLATLGRAELALARGHPQEAADDAERYLRMVDPEEKARRAAGLELLARTRAATGSQPPHGLRPTPSERWRCRSAPPRSARPLRWQTEPLPGRRARWNARGFH